MRIAAVLLAAGLSTRFGVQDKMAAPLDGLALGRHVARTLNQLDIDARYVVCRDLSLDWPGFAPILNDAPGTGLSHSIALGVAAARGEGAEAVLIALADMPFVPIGHFRALIGRLGGASGIVASSDGRRYMPPALFGADWFDVLQSLSGDRGARDLLDEADLVVADPAALIDIDRPADMDVGPYEGLRIRPRE